jgi:hypothetical protein
MPALAAEVTMPGEKEFFGELVEREIRGTLLENGKLSRRRPL